MSTVSRKQIENLIPLAIHVIKDVFCSEGEKSVSKTYHGYFSSFGADMVNSTPLAAIIFYEEAKKTDGEGSSGGKEDRSRITSAILRLLQKDQGKDSTIQNYKLLSEYYMKSTERALSKKNIIVAASALKIALRTFPKSS